MRSACWVAVLAVVSLAGCYGGGLSVREGAHDFPLMIYEIKGLDEPAGEFRLDAPMRVAVAQIGEIAPEQGLLDGLRSEKDVFGLVSGLPLPPLGEAPYGRGDTADPRRARARETAGRTLALARRLRATHALIVGGYIETSKQDTFAAVLNLLILPAWLVPSVEVKASGKAVAALVDVSSEHVVLISTAQAQGEGTVPPFYASDKEKDLIAALRLRLARDVAQQVAVDARAAGGK